MNETIAKEIKDAIAASPTLDAKHIEIASLRVVHDIDTDRNRVRVEMTFDVR